MTHAFADPTKGGMGVDGLGRRARRPERSGGRYGALSPAFLLSGPAPDVSSVTDPVSAAPILDARPNCPIGDPGGSRNASTTKGVCMFSLLRAAGAAAVLGCSVAALMVACSDNGPAGPDPPDPGLAAQGKDIFRFDTYGDESFWTDTLRIHDVITAAVDPRPR